MLIGPVFTREAVTAPRRARLYLTRASYVTALLVLMCTAWLVLAGTQSVRDVGDLARFGALMFPILTQLQLALAVFFSALLAASAVAQEKDRRTLVLLLLTNLTNSELVLGKLLASMLSVVMLLAASAPFFVLMALLGGIGFDQIARVLVVTLLASLVAGSLGSTMALWREKTFQAVALTALVIVSWIGAWELVAAETLGRAWAGMSCEVWATGFSPWRAVLAATGPGTAAGETFPWSGGPVTLFLITSAALCVVLNLVAILRVRVWNPSRESRRRSADEAERASIWGAEHDLAEEQRAGSDRETSPDTDHAAGATELALTGAAHPSVHAAPGKLRHVWNNPIIWREMRTWAYGRRVILIRLAYLAIFALAAMILHGIVTDDAARVRGARSVIPAAAKPMLPVFLLSLALVNAMAVTSITTERDGRALDLLLATDLTPKEIIFGKLGGVFYNTKEIVALPMLMGVYLRMAGGISTENLVYLLVGLAVMYLFSAMLGIHAAITYANSRSAIAVSLGTVFFLTLGIATCMQIMIAFSGSFRVQLQPFLAFMAGGGVALYLALGLRNPSPAIALAAFGSPIATFYAITSFMLDNPLGVFLVTSTTYGFMTAALMVPAIHEFDVAMGRTTGGEE